MTRNIIGVFMIVVSLSACEKSREAKLATFGATTAEAKVLVPKIDNEELAKLILKPKRVTLDVTRDPFQPLHGGPFTRVSGISTVGTGDIQGFQFLGVARMNNDIVAFLKSDEKKGTYRKDDKIKDFLIKEISDDRVILSNGIQTVTLKRGDKFQSR